ncbi:hypothetical protein VTH06DRAFT_6285 [Thermothelomyces fergusii]
MECTLAQEEPKRGFQSLLSKGQAQAQNIQSPPPPRGCKRPIDDSVEPAADWEGRQRIPSPPSTAQGIIMKEPGIGGGYPQTLSPIGHWVETRRWPEELKRPGEFPETDFEADYPLAEPSYIPSTSRNRLGTATPETPSDQRPREEKSIPYRNPSLLRLLRLHNTLMDVSDLGITDTSRQLVSALLSGQQPVPHGTLFDDDIFANACRNLDDRNEAKIIQDIARLVVPSAESLALRDSKYRYLAETVNEGWNDSIPLRGLPRPQPDYAVGFKEAAFTGERFTKLMTLVGSPFTKRSSYYTATWYMSFPFLTCEVKTGTTGLDIADRKNAHSMTLAVRGIVQLFRAVNRENEVNRQILAFSVSHDHRSVRIYGHYPVITGKDTQYFRHPIAEISIAAANGRDKWTAHRFTKNVYDIWAPQLFEMICSAIDQVPSDVSFDVPTLSESTRLSQQLESTALSEAGSVSAYAEMEKGVGERDWAAGCCAGRRARITKAREETK